MLQRINTFVTLGIIGAATGFMTFCLLRVSRNPADLISGKGDFFLGYWYMFPLIGGVGLLLISLFLLFVSSRRRRGSPDP